MYSRIELYITHIIPIPARHPSSRFLQHAKGVMSPIIEKAYIRNLRSAL